MKTFIYVRDADQAVVGVGMIYDEKTGTFTKGVKNMIAANGGNEDAGILAEANRNKPVGCTARIVDTADLPGGTGDHKFDKLFYRVNGEDENGVPFEHCGWTDANPGQQVDVHMDGAKQIAHMHRRVARDKAFEPYLKITSKAAQGIPLKANENAADAQQAMTDYKTNVDDVCQAGIDDALDVTELKSILTINGII